MHINDSWDAPSALTRYRAFAGRRSKKKGSEIGNLVVLLRPVLVLFVTISSSFSPYVASLKNVQITKKLKLLTTFDWWLQDNFCGNFWRLSIFHVCDPIIFQIAKTIAFTQDCVAFCINIYLSFVIFHKVMRLRILYFELQNGDNLW